MKGVPDALEEEIIEILNSTLDEPTQITNEFCKSERTTKIKDGLCKLGRHHGFAVSASCKDADTGEWLYDLIWAKVEKEKLWTFHEMPLAMECEWGLDEFSIGWDFEKLLVAKARYKVFIFNKAKSDEIEITLGWLVGMIENFKSVLPGERYLLAALSRSDNKFRFCSVIPQSD